MIFAPSYPAVPGERACLCKAGSVLLALLLLALPTALVAEDQSSAAPAGLGEASTLSAGPLSYTPGRGLRLGSTGAVIGGFTNIKAEHSEESGAEFTLDTLNFFLIFDRFTRFRAVAELQMKDIMVIDKAGTGTKDFAFDVRRLFGDFAVSDALRVRAGTFLTPVGYWNLILAQPLTWTTERPLIIEQSFFQETTTGLMLHGSTPVPSGQLGYSLFSQFLKPLADDRDLVPPDHTIGARLVYDTGRAWSVGASYQASETDGARSHLGGLHYLWKHRRGEVLGEFLYQEGEVLNQEDEALGASQWGAYLQGVIEVHRPFYLVGRYEHFDQRPPEPTL
ncbi:MAG: hypothetical protein ACRD1T_21455, partial [Acidimicrobiia bacterium]